jgi:hypothetical protein
MVPAACVAWSENVSPAASVKSTRPVNSGVSREPQTAGFPDSNREAGGGEVQPQTAARLQLVGVDGIRASVL